MLLRLTHRAAHTKYIGELIFFFKLSKGGLEFQVPPQWAEISKEAYITKLANFGFNGM